MQNRLTDWINVEERSRLLYSEGRLNEKENNGLWRMQLREGESDDQGYRSEDEAIDKGE